MRSAASSLWQSRKFLLLLLDTLISLVVFFVGKYASPASAQDLLFLVGSLQPVFVAIILGIAHEDAAEKSALPYYEDITPVEPTK